MPDNRWQRIKSVMLAAGELPPTSRSAAITQLCQGDAALEAEVRDLLEAAADEHMARFFADPAAAVGLPAPSLSPGPIDQPPGVGRADVSTQGTTGLIGRYVRAGVIGQGRTGVVFRARDLLAQRDVAIKLLQPEMVSSESERRLLAEGRALARLSHSGIARVLDVGTEMPGGADGRFAGQRSRPYLVIELVDGPDLMTFVREHNLSTRDKLGLFIQMCEAVEHAHRSAVLHRDLKPANVLVTMLDGQPVVKVLDFGLAKVIGEQQESMATMPGQVLGTLAYMAPEQAGGDPQRADTRADVYSLGALLYHLLAGHPPIATSGLTLVAAARAIEERTPPLLGTVSREFRGDLETIAAKALAKRPDDRYGSASALADDVQNHLAHRPILAAKPTVAYVLLRFIQRRRGLTAAFTIAALCVLIAAAVASVYARKSIVFGERSRLAMATLLNNFVGLQADRIGSSADVRRVLGEIVSQMEPLIESEGDNAQVVADYATLLARLTDVEQADRKLDLAKQHAEAAWAMRSKLVAMSPQNLDLQADLSIATVRRGDIAAQFGDRAEANRLYGEAMRIDEALYAANPTSRKFLSNLVYSYERTAYANLHGRNFEEADRRSARQVELVDLLTQDAPATAQSMWTKATARATRAAVLDNLKRPEARPLRREQLELARQLVKISPTERRYRVMAAGLCARDSADDEPEALPMAESQALATEAMEHLDSLLSANESDETTLRAEVATLEFLVVSHGLTEPPRLLSLAQRSVDRTGVLAVSTPNAYELMAQSRLLLGKVLRRMGRPDDAATHEAESNRLARESILADTWAGDETPIFIRGLFGRITTSATDLDVPQLEGLRLEWTNTQPATPERVRVVTRTLVLAREFDMARELLDRTLKRAPKAEHPEYEALRASLPAGKK